jgi:hypothetical protein
MSVRRSSLAVSLTMSTRSSDCRETQSIASLLEHLKTSSSKWIKAQGVAGFGWQRGYGGFSVSESNTAAVVAYIEKQKEHHLMMTFEDEFRLILQRHRVQFDERYVWD